MSDVDDGRIYCWFLDLIALVLWLIEHLSFIKQDLQPSQISCPTLQHTFCFEGWTLAAHTWSPLSLCHVKAALETNWDTQALLMCKQQLYFYCADRGVGGQIRRKHMAAYRTTALDFQSAGLPQANLSLSLWVWECVSVCWYVTHGLTHSSAFRSDWGEKAFRNSDTDCDRGSWESRYYTYTQYYRY